MPNTIKNADPTPNNPVYMRRGKMLCGAFRDGEGKKPVRMLSTLLPAQELPSGRPKIVNTYNKNMGGVDMTDALMKAYGGQRKHKKPWKKIVLYLFSRILHNAYILYEKNTADTPVKSRLRFIQDVIESLASLPSNPPPRQGNRRARTISVRTLPGKKEKDCCVCSGRYTGGVRRRSRTVCTFCSKGLHSKCVRQHNDCIEF